MSVYSIIPADLNDDSETVIQLLKQTFGNSTDFDYKYLWLYKNNVYENTELYFLQNDDNDNEKVGVQGISGRAFEFNGDMLTAGLVGDFAVSPKHRTLGPGLKLLKTTMNLALESNDFIFSYPNINAIPVVKRAGYKFKKEINRYVKVLKSKTYLQKYMPGILSLLFSSIIDAILYTIDAFKYFKRSSSIKYEFTNIMPGTVDKLWQTSFFKNDCLLQERKKKYIDWRLQEDKSQKVSFFIIRERNSDTLLGYIAYHFNTDEKITYIVDFFAINQSDAIKLMFSSFAYKIRSFGSNSISLEYLGPSKLDAEIKSAGFKMRDSRPVFYIFNNDLNEEKITRNWFLTSWDEDAV